MFNDLEPSKKLCLSNLIQYEDWLTISDYEFTLDYLESLKNGLTFQHV